MSVETEQRKLAAIMFTDMVGYSALSQRDSKLAVELLEEHREILREIFCEDGSDDFKLSRQGFFSRPWAASNSFLKRPAG